jgi:hypothetical protein
MGNIFGNLFKQGGSAAAGAAAQGAAGAAAGTAAQGAAGAAKGGGLPIADIIEGVGKIGVGAADAAKRRQMDFGFNQQRLQQELGIAEMSAKQAGEIARLNFLAQQAATGKEKPKDDSLKPLVIGVAIVGALALGTIIFIAVKR